LFTPDLISGSSGSQLQNSLQTVRPFSGSLQFSSAIILPSPYFLSTTNESGWGYKNA
jgi:hypothetical protein